MSSKIMSTVKAWAGLIGAGATAASAIAGMPVWVTIVGVVATAIAVHQVPDPTVVARTDRAGTFTAASAAAAPNGALLDPAATLDQIVTGRTIP